jgi:hypothetical protein
MFRRFTKKRYALVLSAVGALALAVGAYAYFTSTGTGSSSATAGSSSNYTVVVTPTGSVALTPQTSTDVSAAGGVFQPYTGTVHNNSSGRQKVTLLTANITGATPTTGNTCAASNFSLYSNASHWTVASGGQSATSTDGGTGTTLPSDMAAGATLSFNDIAVYLTDPGSNQDGCQGATVNVSVTAS